MTFDNIIGILAVIFFVVVPLITSVTKGREKRGDPHNQPGGKNWRGGDTPGASPPPSEATTRQAQPQAAEDSLEARLREARRRIEEALSEPQAQTGGTQQRTQPPSGSGSATVITSTMSGGTAATPAGQAVAHRPAPTAPPPRPKPVRRPPPRDRAREPSEDVQVTRLPKSSPYTHGRTSLRSDSGSGGMMSASGVINGIIWHQILSEPPSKRFFRRRTSRLRSP